jgi:hypothetical protein
MSTPLSDTIVDIFARLSRTSARRRGVRIDPIDELRRSRRAGDHHQRAWRSQPPAERSAGGWRSAAIEESRA